jgi:hypothetical protein
VVIAIGSAGPVACPDGLEEGSARYGELVPGWSWPLTDGDDERFGGDGRARQHEDEAADRPALGDLIGATPQ